MKKYSDKIKRKSIKLVIQGMCISEAAKEMNVSHGTLKSWVRKEKKRLGIDPKFVFSRHGSITMEKENKRLKKENRELRSKLSGVIEIFRLNKSMNDFCSGAALQWRSKSGGAITPPVEVAK